MSVTEPHNNESGRKRSEKVGDLVSIYQRGDAWWINYQDHDGRQVRKSLKTRSKKQAKLLAMKKEAELQLGTEPIATTVAGIKEAVDAYDAFLVTEGRKKKTLAKYRKIFKRLIALAATRRVKDMRGLTLQFVDAYRKQRKDAGRAAKTIHTETTVLRQLVNFSLSRDMIDRDPLKGLKLKRPKPTPQPWWTFEQVEIILGTVSTSPYSALYGVLARTGLRIQEAKYLTWDDIDLKNKVLHVRGKQINDDGEYWSPKGEDQRVVPVGKHVLRILESLPRKARWVFTTPSRLKRLAGQPIDERRTLDHLKKALKKLGLPGHQHTFRHSLISHALVSGTPEAVVRRWAGHVDEQILKHYTHIADVDSKAYMAKLFDEQGDSSSRGASTNGDAVAHGEPDNIADSASKAADSELVQIQYKAREAQSG